MPEPGSRTHCEYCKVKLRAENSFWYGPQRKGPCCLSCHKQYKQNEYQRRKERGLQQNERFKRYGVTQERFDKMLEFQQNGCAICRQPFTDKICVDHNHLNNEVRGLLCNNCNLAIGHMRDDEDLILKIMDYLKRTTWKEKTA